MAYAPPNKWTAGDPGWSTWSTSAGTSPKNCKQLAQLCSAPVIPGVTHAEELPWHKHMGVDAPPAADAKTGSAVKECFKFYNQKGICPKYDPDAPVVPIFRGTEDERKGWRGNDWACASASGECNELWAYTQLIDGVPKSMTRASKSESPLYESMESMESIYNTRCTEPGNNTTCPYLLDDNGDDDKIDSSTNNMTPKQQRGLETGDRHSAKPDFRLHARLHQDTATHDKNPVSA